MSVVNSGISFEVEGLPATKGSTRSFRHSKTGRIVTTTDNLNLPAWESLVRLAARASMGRSRGVALGELPLFSQGPVRVSVAFALQRPLAHFVGGKRGGRLRADAPHWHDRKPDLDKLTRAIGDALVRARVINDDGQIAQDSQTKVWAAQGQEPGVAVVVEQIEEATNG